MMKVIKERLEVEEGEGGVIKAMKPRAEVHKAALGQWQQIFPSFFVT